MSALPYPLSDTQKYQLLHLLGLDQISFQLIEKAGMHTLRIREVKNGQVNYVVDATTSCPTRLTIEYGDLSKAVPMPPKTLWQELLPSPWDRLSCVGDSSGQHKVDLFGELKSSAWDELFEAFRKLEDKIAETEVSCLTLRGRTGCLPLLIHSRSHKIRRVGTHPQMGAVLEQFLTQSLTENSINSLLGARGSFLCLNLPEAMSDSPIEALTKAIDSCLNDPASFIQGLERDGVASSYELGL